VYQDIVNRAKTEPQGLQARTKLARILAQQNQLDEANRLLDEVLKENPKDEDALVLRGNIALVRNEPLKAIGTTGRPSRGSPTRATCSCFSAAPTSPTRSRSSPRRTCARRSTSSRANVQARVALAQFLAQTGKVDAAIEQLDAALKTAPGNVGVLEIKARCSSPA